MLNSKPAQPKVRYDNLNATVAQVLGLSRARVETDRWTAFKPHFTIQSFYCRPSIDGAHEKGGVEGQIGYFRRNHFTPVAEAESLAELTSRSSNRTDMMAGAESAAGSDIDEYFDDDRPLLLPLLEQRFETGRAFTTASRPLQPDRRPHQPLPPVPVRLIGKQVRVILHASHLGLRQERGSDPAREAHRQRQLPPGAGSLPRSPRPQARRLPRGNRAGTGPIRREVQPGPRRMMGCGGQSSRRRRRHPGSDPAGGC
ncbi:hypothetical protein [Streptomyces lydicus]|uniref:hypothetical protein n=1 Tax=Streptomyces lydicus TaxID=47763 RepID=UPI00286FD4C0|nr:hypothetical protein [Streptomyces lydicus]